MKKIRGCFLVFLFLVVFYNERLYSQDTIYWKNNRKLTFYDFQASPPENSKFEAISFLKIFNKTLSDQSDYILTLNAIFICHNSWFKEKTSTFLLMHEQGHFDIAEIFARKARKLLGTKSYTLSNILTEYNRITKNVYRDYDIMQAQYDEETAYSKNKYCQEWWNKYIEEQLKELQQYSNPIVILHINEK